MNAHYPDDASLEALLRTAGRTAAAGPLPNDLADRVRARLARRRRTRRAALGAGAAGAALVALVAGLVAFRDRSGPIPSPAAGPSVVAHGQEAPAGRPAQAADREKLLAAARRLRVEAEQTRRLVEEAIRRQQMAELSDRLGRLAEQPDALAAARLEIERTAFLVIDEAEREGDVAESLDARRQAYRRVIRQFPETYWAQVAQTRLDGLTNQGAPQ